MIATHMAPAFFGNLRGWEWIIILVVILLLFGGRKIPELMKGIGKGVHSFKQGMQEAKDEINKPLEDSPKKDNTTRTTSKGADEPLGKDRS